MSRKYRTRALRALSQVQQVSALAFGSFVVVHLTAPALALVAPSDPHELATGTMLLGRVWYQNAVSEPVLVWGALAVHLTSSLARKAIVLFWAPKPNKAQEDAQGTGSDQDPSQQHIQTWTQKLAAAVQAATRRASLASDLHTLAGTLLVPFVLHHAYLNRIVPSRSTPPVNSLSPSELDYAYVAHGFGPAPATAETSLLHPASAVSPRAAFSTVAYGVLIGLTVYHSTHGVRKILRWRNQEKARSHKRLESDSGKPADSPVPTPTSAKSRRTWDVGAGVATAVVCGGLFRLVQGVDKQPPFLLNRFEACYSLVWPYATLHR
ncbi:hypothetical protein OC835_004514 [Tilletia horrida]|nr:hypothetical protein OC835_004514 [Tilletia horrida]